VNTEELKAWAEVNGAVLQAPTVEHTTRVVCAPVKLVKKDDGNGV